MTIQQLHYIISVADYQHFGQAAKACNITQSTLSVMIQKLESEFDVIIFDRKKQPIEPTPLGQKLIDQARVILYHTSQFEELVKDEKNKECGNIRLGIIPTVAPYILPDLFKQLKIEVPRLSLEVSEMTTARLLHKLERAEIDMGLLATPLNHPDLLEIPLYYEKFYAYVSPSHPLYKEKSISSVDFTDGEMWVLKEGHCLRDQVLNFCSRSSEYLNMYEAGSIDTLIRIVDANGGYTIIPELHIHLFNEEQKKHIRPLHNPTHVREISLIVRNDYVKERLLNVLVEQVKNIIPSSMIDERLKKFAVRL